MIECKKCLQFKDVLYFWKCSNNKRGYQSYCKDCVNISKKERYCEKSKDILEYNKKWNNNNKEKKSNSNREYRIKNKDLINKKSKEYVIKNKDILKIKRKEKFNNDPCERFIHSVRCRQNKVLKGYMSTTKNLGCDKSELFKHIENQFVDGMSWDNRYSPIDKERNNPYKTWSTVENI